MRLFLTNEIIQGIKEILSLESDIQSINLLESDSSINRDQNIIEFISNQDKNLFINKYEFLIRTQLWAIRNGYSLSYTLKDLNFSFEISKDSSLEFIGNYCEMMEGLVSAIEYISGEVYE